MSLHASEKNFVSTCSGKAGVAALNMPSVALILSFGICNEEQGRLFSRSVFVVEDIVEGEPFSRVNLLLIRPNHGLHTRYFDAVTGRKANQPVQRRTPLIWEHSG